MKRTTTEVLRRGFDSMVANWPLLLIQIAETIVLMAIAIGTIVAIVIPIAVSAGLGKLDLSGATDPVDAMIVILLEHWMLIAYIAMAITLLLLILITIHSFVVAGSAHVYLAADRAGSRSTVPTRRRFEAFTVDRWLAGGRQSWWVVFWIYNVVWGIASMVLLLPLLPVAIGILLLRESPAAIAVGCVGLVVTLGIGIPVAFLANLVARKAIIDAADGAADTMTAVRQAWREVREDFGRHLAVALVLTAISFGGAMFIASFSAGFAISNATPFVIVTLPLRLALSVINGAFSAAMAGWFLASLAAMAAEQPQ